MNGKNKCKLLKDIRKQIAEQNDIEYVTSECKYKGDCSGTCPKCESEVRYLEEQLRLRQRAGKAVAVAGIAAALMVTSTGCDLPDFLTSSVDGDVPYVSQKETVAPGEVPYEDEDLIFGRVSFAPEETAEELTGDIAYIPEETTEPENVVIKGFFVAPEEE